MTAREFTGSRQDGLILAMALMFLTLLSVTAAVAPRMATLDLARASAVDAWSRADAAAANGLVAALAQGGLASTVPGPIAAGTVSDASYAVHREFLGHRTIAPDGSDSTLLEWHFLLTSVGSADRGARSIHASHLLVLAPAPVDPDACTDPGCLVPPICIDLAPCETGVYAAPITVSWHVPEDPR